MRNIKKIATISICSILLATTLPKSMPVYADTLGSIDVKAKFETKFYGDIYVIVLDDKGKQKMALLSQNNNYEYKLENLNSGKYSIKNVFFYESSDAGDKKSVKADYMLNLGDLKLTEDNQNSDISIDVKSINEDNKDSSNNDTNTDSNEDNKSQNTNDEKSKTDNKVAENKSKDDSVTPEDKERTERKVNFYFQNFVLDAFLIIGLGALWFFKVRNKDKDGKDKE